ncbi:sensor histidine kinase [Peribacillus frigoritolerans]|uniref:sensor histidine kinase n=1 Tax=Peribacillus frigoritolerans TaxID=450367 RepID=UPI003ECFD62E
MQSWYHIFPKNTGLSPYVWIIFCILPFYFIFKSSSMLEIVFGIVMIILFFISYGLSFVSKGWPVYVWTAIQIIISISMTIFFSYIYFSLFLAFFIGNVQNKVGFFVLYSIQLLATIVSVNIGFIMKDPTFFSQFPFMLICVVGVILLPFNTYNRNKRGMLEEQLEDAHKRISELGKMEERQRIARDLHDTLGQKLSLIGLKSDLAGKLIDLNPETAKKEIKDIRQTARTALKEVREMVSEMRGSKLSDEIIRVKQILKAAEIEFDLEGTAELQDTPLLVETVLSMCLKEAVTNIVKHSGADCCNIVIEELQTGVTITVQDNGVGLSHRSEYIKGNGLQGMKERLEFVNGSLDIKSTDGTTLYIRVPNAIKNNG